tara:strand:- start:433 stop:951 length:519 start_codon:yes stop_codon:yes gene_type:complete
MLIWITGISASGKSTIAKRLYKVIKKRCKNTIFLDGDIFRDLNNNDLKYTLKDRNTNAQRITKFCKYFVDQNINVICAANLTSQKYRNWCKDNIKGYYEVFIDVPLEILVKRDFKNLYKKALKGKVKNVVGVDIPFKYPKSPNLILDNSKSKNQIKNLVELILKKSKFFEQK